MSNPDRAAHTHFLQAAGEKARHALQRPGDGDDLLTEVVQDVDGEGAQGAAALPAQAVVLLHGVEHVLAHDVSNFILVVAFKTNKSFMDLKKNKQRWQ